MERLGAVSCDTVEGVSAVTSQALTQFAVLSPGARGERLVALERQRSNDDVRSDRSEMEPVERAARYDKRRQRSVSVPGKALPARERAEGRRRVGARKRNRRPKGLLSRTVHRNPSAEAASANSARPFAEP